VRISSATCRCWGAEIMPVEPCQDRYDARSSSRSGMAVGTRRRLTGSVQPMTPTVSSGSSARDGPQVSDADTLPPVQRQTHRRAGAGPRRDDLLNRVREGLPSTCPDPVSDVVRNRVYSGRDAVQNERTRSNGKRCSASLHENLLTASCLILLQKYLSLRWADIGLQADLRGKLRRSVISPGRPGSDSRAPKSAN
jgi:hypothetical protein